MPIDVFYEAVLVDRVMQAAASPTFSVVDRILALESVVWSKDLNNEGFASVSTRPENVSSDVASRLLTPDEKPMELWIYRTDLQTNTTQKVFAGPIIGLQIQGRNRTVTFHARGILYYLRYWYILQDYSFTNTDQFTIAKTIIDDFQALSYGNYGIDTSGIGTSGVTRTQDYKRTELRNIGKILADLSADDSGFDFAIDPTTRALSFYYPQRGTDKSSTIVVDARNLMSFMAFLDLTAGDFASIAIGAATGFNLTTPLWSQKENTTRRSQFGAAIIASNFEGVENQATLDRYVQSLIDVHSNFRLVFGGAGGTTTGEGSHLMPIEGFTPFDVDPGDTIAVTVDLGYGEYNLLRDVTQVVVRHEADGGERMTVAVT